MANLLNLNAAGIDISSIIKLKYLSTISQLYKAKYFQYLDLLLD